MCSIHVYNHSSQDTVTYSLALLVGDVTPVSTTSPGSLLVQNPNTEYLLTWPVVQGKFKVLVPLKKGENTIQLRYFAETLTIILHYRVPALQRFVRPVYIRCCDESGVFQGPDYEDTSMQSACMRISLGASLLQTFTAEKLYTHGLGRHTFVLEHDLDDSQPTCHVFTSKLKVCEAHAMSGAALWTYFARELMSSRRFSSKDKCKWFSFTAFTRYQPPPGTLPKSHSEVLKYTKGYTALGGGGLALFATGNLHTWAENLQQVAPRFTDDQKIDRSKLMDDSAYRQYHWANYSTGLGSSLHELGHTFDLAHTPTGVMARGFDDLYRVFSVHPSTAGSRCCHRDASHLASSRMAYSPTQSPVHRSRYNGLHSSGSSSISSSPSSPRPSPLLRRHKVTSSYAPTPPTSPTDNTLQTNTSLGAPEMIQIETAFRKLHANSTQTFTVLNYDGSSTQKTVTRHKNGTETSSELHVQRNGDHKLKETIKHIPTGNTRTTMSMSRSMQGLCDEAEDNGTENSIHSNGDHLHKDDRHGNNIDTQSRGNHMSDVNKLEWSQSSGSNSVNNKDNLVANGNLMYSHNDVTTPPSTINGHNDITTPSSFLAQTSQITSNSHNSVMNKHTTVSNGHSPPIISHGPSSIHSSITSTLSNGVAPPSNGHGSLSNHSPMTSTHISANHHPVDKNLITSSHLSTAAILFSQRDAGAHWYRSSAVMLRYHKWFNQACPEDNGKLPQLSGCIITCKNGLRLVELRSLPEGVVFHHWEFIHHKPPSQFKLRYSEVRELSHDLTDLMVVVCDNYGNILKKKIALLDLHCDD